MLATAQFATEQLVRDLEDLARAGRWEWNVRTDEVRWSAELRDIFGVDAVTCPASYERFLATVHPDDRAFTDEVIQRAITERAPQDYLHRIVRSDGEVRLLRSLVRVDTNEHGEVVRLSGACQDVTARRDMLERLRRAQGLASSGLVAAGLAHDLNNLLGAVICCSGALAKTVRSAGIETSIVDSLEEVAQRAAALTGRIQGMAANTDALPVRLDVNAAVGHVAELVRDIIPCDIDLTVRLGGEVGAVMVDLADFDRVLWNLVVNARDAQHSGGGIELGVSSVTVLEVERQVRYTRLTVSDRGDGMDELTLRRAFEPLFTTKGSRGCGLGLAVVQDIVRGAGGFLSVRSTIGRGTRVHVYLPSVD